MEQIEKEIRKLAGELDRLGKLKRKVTKKIIQVCLEIVELAEKEKITLREADRLFGYFLLGDILSDKLHDIIFDGASLELPKKWLKGRPEVNIKSIKERLLKLK